MTSNLVDLYRQTPPRHESVDLRQTLVPMLDGLVRALGYERVLVVLFDAGRGSLRSSFGLNVQESISESLEVPLTEVHDPLVVALMDGVPQRVDDVETDPCLSEHNRAVLLEMRIASFVVAPLQEATELVLPPGDAPRPLRQW